jgi:hypothetical protein
MKLGKQLAHSQAQLGDARAEAQRYREALERIQYGSWEDLALFDRSDLTEALLEDVRLAREALAKTDAPSEKEKP